MKKFTDISLKLFLGFFVVGIIMVVITLIIGVNWSDMYLGYENGKWVNSYTTEQKAYTFSTEDIQKLSIDQGAGKLYIKKSEDDQIKVETASRSLAVEVTEESGTLTIDENDRGYFGICIGESDYSTITIYLPENVSFEDAKISLGAGRAEVEVLQAEKTNVDVGAGEFIGNTMISENLTLSVGAGNIVLHDSETKEMKVDNGVGNVGYTGILTGDGDIDSGVGNVTLNLTGEAEDFNYDIDSGISTVYIDGDKASVEDGNNEIDNGADKKLNLDCGVGEISINFQ